MYKVEEVAKELNISRQAVYKKLNKQSIQEFIVIVDGIKHLTKEGVDKLKGIKVEHKEAEEVDVDQVEVEIGATSLNSSDNKLVEILNNVIASKDKDINHLKEENKKLMDLMQQQNQLILNSQKLQEKALNNTEMLLLEKRQQLLERQEENKKNEEGFFTRLKYVFKKK
ncbi:MAG: DNA-binding protein [Sarcina sp.]